MQLIGRYLSPFTRRVAVTLRLLEIDFDRKPLTAWKDLDEVRHFNPVGRVPILVLDDGEAIFDSAAILDYLDERVGPERALTPQGGAARRQVMRLTAAALGVIEKAVHARYEQRMRPEEKVHQPWLEHNLSQVVSGLEWLDRQIKGFWITGESLTQADVTTVVMYDFVRLVDDQLLPNGRYENLDDLVHRAYEIKAFRDTDPSRE